MAFNLGRKPRAHNPSVPHLSALLAGITLPPPPPNVDYSKALPPQLGAMLNDSLGDCTCAAWGHAVQVWTANASASMVTLPDSDIENLYEGACGYVPGNPASDQGGIEQDVLQYLVTTGLAGNKLAAFVEVDPAKQDDVQRTIAWCGVCYIGFNVPGYLMSGLTAPGSLWDVDPSGDQTVEGGHAVVLAGYDTCGNYKVISWGNLYTMTPAFFAKWVEESYALADASWLTATGKTLGGWDLAALESQMAAIKGYA